MPDKPNLEVPPLGFFDLAQQTLEKGLERYPAAPPLRQIVNLLHEEVTRSAATMRAVGPGIAPEPFLAHLLRIAALAARAALDHYHL